MTWFPSLPDGFRQVFNFICAVICAYLFLWIFAWMLHWAKAYGFLPMP